ncbi:MAG: hypothetical protein KF898_07060 [Parachlamydiales bacterium]|nr:hypothetical protein [Verrucomicrobiota bacterium]MBX3719389.1 hypothetical protein [Candidatus Acheromyda pituitae]
MPVSATRSGSPDTCFPHIDVLKTDLVPSQMIKENLLAAYAEVDRIDWSLDQANEVEIKKFSERLFSLQKVNNAIGDYIVAVLQDWKQKDIPTLEQFQISSPQGNYEQEKARVELEGNKAWEEVLQLKKTAPLSEQLSVKIMRLFEKASLAPFKPQLPAPVYIQSQLPRIHTILWNCPTIKVEASNPSQPSTLLVNANTSGPAVVEPSSVSNQPLVTARIVVKYEGAESDKLFIRGTGPNMSWGPGIEMRKEGSLWIYESTAPFETFEFKMMLNDQLWEAGENHKIASGKPVELSSVAFHDLH